MNIAGLLQRLGVWALGMLRGLGHSAFFLVDLIRSLPAGSFDSELCLALGQHAVHAGMSGRTGMVLGTWRGRFTHVPLALTTDTARQLDPDGVTWQRVLESTGQPASLHRGAP